MRRVLGPQRQRLPDHVELRRRVVGRGAAASAQGRAAGGPVDRPAVVGVDEREVLELVAAIDVRHARRGQLEQELRQREPAPDSAHAVEERIALRAARPRAPRTPGPRARAPRSARASSCSPCPRAAPSRDRRRAARARSAAHRRASGRRAAPRAGRRDHRAPRARRARARPTPRQPRRARDARAHVRRALRVVRVRRQHVQREARRPRAFASWNSSTPRPKRAGSAADLVQRGQPEVAVEGGVLDALRHHRPGRLLEADDELLVPRLLRKRMRRSSSLTFARPISARSASSTTPRTARCRCGRRGTTRARAAGSRPRPPGAAAAARARRCSPRPRASRATRCPRSGACRP